MKLKFLGAAGTVTGSGFLLTANSGAQILIDLGLFQGPPEIDALNYQPLQLDATRLSGVVLTHAHLDHCGRLPMLEKLGYVGHFYMTAPTAELTLLTLLDSAKIAAEDHPQDYLYDPDQVRSIAARFKSVDYGQLFTVGDFTITLRDAGHIIGPAIVEVAVDGRKIVFSGDLGNTPEDLTRPTETIHSADTIILESTYGDRLHPPGEAIDILRSEINIIEQTQGTLLIPAFSLERTQELLHLISHLKFQKHVRSDTQVFLDSPMAQKATNIYEKYRSFLNAEITEDFRTSDPFLFPGLRVIRDRRDSMRLNKISGAKVIIAGAGMMTGGRILSHALHFLPLGSTRLLLVGYQGEGTLGRQIQSGEKGVKIGERQVHINAHIGDTQVMSSHADQGQLFSWIKTIQGVRQAILVHGEDTPRQTLAQKITSELGVSDIVLPILNEEIDLNF